MRSRRTRRARRNRKNSGLRICARSAALVVGVFLFVALLSFFSPEPIKQRLRALTSRNDLAEILGQAAPAKAAPEPLPVSDPALGTVSDPAQAPVPEPAPVPDRAYKIPVLMYHDIGDRPAGLTVTPGSFRSQVEALVAGGYETVSLDLLLRAFGEEPVRLPGKGVILTFDDAYSAVYHEAYPILKEHGYVGTLFVITDLVGKRGYVDWEQIDEMAAGGWTIGSHTVHHVDLRLLSGSKLEQEIVSARELLRKKTGQPVLAFCYPSGKYSDQVIEAVKAAGHLGAVTTDPGTAALQDDPFTLVRVRIDGRESLRSFKTRLSLP